MILRMNSINLELRTIGSYGMNTAHVCFICTKTKRSQRFFSNLDQIPRREASTKLFFGEAFLSERPQRAMVPLVSVKTFHARFCPFRLKSPYSPKIIIIAFRLIQRRRHRRSCNKSSKPATSQGFDFRHALLTKKSYSL